uniref:Glycosyltransferase family 92 protein n=1 Tax=Caenorhabditis tropicalis TaxID=1561998 RepID=A0A1I7V416_9PELO
MVAVWILLILFFIPFAFTFIQVTFSKDLKTLEEVKNAKEEIVHYVNLNETVSIQKLEKNSELPNSYLEEKEDPLFSFNSNDCPIEEWNNIRTDSVPNLSRHREWANMSIGRRNYLYHDSFALLAAFVFKDQITVTMTSENQFNKTVYCRYYDCRRKEIPDQFESFVYPESTVFCARRAGAKYISISETLEETPEYSIPIVPRIEKPSHYLTVCMATLYGDEPKFLQIVDFIEYYKLQGATFFHIYLREVTGYDRVLLDDYVRTGDVEVIKMHDHFWRDDFMWHNAQINDCHHRNKYFSKWTAVVDIDERIEMRSDEFKTITSFLDSVHDPNIINLHFKVQWIIKDANSPAKYENDQQLTKEMLFHKFQNLSQVGSFWEQPKCIIRPEKIAMMTIHAPMSIYSGIRRSLVNETIGVVRHYRNVEQRVFAGALERMMVHAPFSIQPIIRWIDEVLTSSILNRIKWVYDIVNVPCSKKQAIYKKHGGINAPCWLEQQKNEPQP